MEQKLIKARFRIPGPVKLSSFERNCPNPEWERFNDAQYWCACVQLQVKRLQESLKDQSRPPSAGREFMETGASPLASRVAR